ncbi:apolipophorins [Brachyhypopomus gauderio]|uniref:apolipophorins n=1 Tax=Brachyhypopomus gauderio TaxID=698409 RepID=UPI004040EAD9
MQRGQKHTYRFSTSVTSSLKDSSQGSCQLAFDCVVDISTIPGCPDMVLRLRNPQIKQSSLKRDNSVLRQKNMREALEKNPLRFLLQGGKVTGLCPREAEQVWTLNIKRAILSMFQTSHSGRAQETVKETDVHGTCMSSYELKGPLLVKTRHVQQCLTERVNDFWWQSVPIEDGMTVDASVKCTQLHGPAVMDKVNCTETVALVPLSGSMDQVQTSTVSTLNLLRTLEGIPVDPGLQDEGYLTDLRFKVESENPTRGGPRSAQEVSGTVRRLCAHSADQQQQSELFLSLVLQLRSLSLQQLKDIWQEISFKCRDDWQPLLEALPACGSEACVHFTTSLILNEEIDRDHVVSLLGAITFASHPSPSMISHISGLLKYPLLRPKTILALSSLVYRLCQKVQTSCNQILEVQQFVHVLKGSLESGCGGQEAPGITEVLHVLKAVGNIGAAAGTLTPQLNTCIRNLSTPLELRLAAVEAFRRFPCHSERGVLTWAYQRQHEDVEVRIAAYQQLMSCPDQEVFKTVRATLRNETSTQVGSFVWSHLTNLQKTEDPLKKDLMESLPHDIISKDFDAEPWKYSSHMDFTMDTGVAVTNVEGALVFSPMSFLPRSAMSNMTVHILGRSFNLLEVSLRMENAERFLWRMFEGHDSHNGKPADGTQSTSHGGKRGNRGERSEEKWSDPEERLDKNETCPILNPLKAKSTGQRRHSEFRCWINVKMFGSDISFMTCNELIGQMRDLSLSLAGFTVKLLKGQEVKLNYRAIALVEELVLPSLSGVPIKLSINISSFYSLGVKGTASYKDLSQFSLAGYIKPNAYAGISARIGVDGALGRAGMEWATQVRSSTSLDGGAYMHNGQSLKMVLNVPEDVMDVIFFSSRMYHVSGESREELSTSRTLKEKTTCTPKTWSKMLGWQLCSDVTYPVSLMGRDVPQPGPVLFTLRFQKLDKGLQKYILEAAYAFVLKKNSWIPLEANLLIFLGTPQSSIPRDVSVDFSFSPHRLNLKMTHPLKTILIQGQLTELNGLCSGRAELLVDDSYHYYLKGLKETTSFPSETRTHYELEAKIAANGLPVLLSVNVTHGPSKKISVSAKLRNVFSKDASFSVQLGRRQDDGQRQYSMDAGIFLPNVLTMRILGMLGRRGPDWSLGSRVRYGLSEDNMGECHTSQNLREEVRQDEEQHSVRVEHEFVCSHISSINHKIQLRHERSPIHIQSSLDLSYGKHWNQASNKDRVLLSQSIRNQSGPSLTSYALEFSLRIPEQKLNYKTQLLHSHQKRRKSESSTHLKVNYNDQIPLVAGLHWKDMSAKASLRKWEGSFNMDTPWLYVHVAHKLTQPQYGATRFTSDITTRKWITIHNLVMEGLFRERSRDVEGQLHVFTPAVTYLKFGAQSMLGKHSVNASCSVSTAWTPAMTGEILLGSGKELKTLAVNTSFGKQTLNISARLNTLDKKLKKKLVVMSVTLSEQNTSYLELEMGGRVEEMRKDKHFYKKRWALHFRQPLRFLPQSLLFQETFTVDVLKGIYILESKTLLHDNRKAIHVLTLGSRSQHPHVCSSLIHSFNLDYVPRDSEICISILNNQTVHQLRGRLWTAKEERLVVLGQLQLHNEASQQTIAVKFNFTQLLQLDLPSSISLDASLLKNHWISMESEYSAKGKVTMDDTDYDAYLTVKRSTDGKTHNSIFIGTDGKKNARLDVFLANTVVTGVRAVVFDLSFQQTLLPVVIADGHIHLSANASSNSFSGMCVVGKREEMFRAELSTAVMCDPWLQLSFSGHLNISLPGFPGLPHISSAICLFNHSTALAKGELMVSVDEAVYGVELTRGLEDDGSGGTRVWERPWLCALAQGPRLCVSIHSSPGQHVQKDLQAQISHSVPWLLTAGLPAEASAGVHVNRSGRGLFARAHLHAGARELKVTVRKEGRPTGATSHLLVNCTVGTSPDHLSGSCYSEALDQSLWMDVRLNLTESIRIEEENSEVSLASLEIQGHHLSSSGGLMVNLNHNISSLQRFVPRVFRAKSQLNQRR